MKRSRCPNGSRKSKSGKSCIKKTKQRGSKIKKKCPRGSIKSKSGKSCIKKSNTSKLVKKTSAKTKEAKISRCPNGSRRSPKKSKCEVKNEKKTSPKKVEKISRCPNGSRRSPKTSKCEVKKENKKSSSPKKTNKKSSSPKKEGKNDSSKRSKRKPGRKCSFNMKKAKCDKLEGCVYKNTPKGVGCVRKLNNNTPKLENIKYNSLDVQIKKLEQQLGIIGS